MRMWQRKGARGVAPKGVCQWKRRWVWQQRVCVFLLPRRQARSLLLQSFMAGVAEENGDALVLDGVQTVCVLVGENKNNNIN